MVNFKSKWPMIDIPGKLMFPSSKAHECSNSPFLITVGAASNGVVGNIEAYRQLRKGRWF